MAMTGKQERLHPKEMMRIIGEYLGPLDVGLQFVDSIASTSSGKRRFTISYLSSKDTD